MKNNLIGNTPMIKVNKFLNNEVYCKYEGGNFFGSAKDRSAWYVLNKLLETGKIDHDTEIIESSSGNMGVALAAICGKLGLKVTIVVDKAISELNEFLIRAYGANVVKVTQADANGSYLIARLSFLKEYLKTHDNIYWFNQYGNELVCEAYRETVGTEIIEEVPEADYVFVAISSGGTINGISQAVKRKNKNTKIIAVDCEGSKIFCSDTKKKRYLTGIGSSIISDNVQKTQYDDYIIVSQESGVQVLKELLNKEQIFAGGSSGCVYAGAKEYIKKNNLENKKIVCVFHDRGERYFQSIYGKF